MNGQLYEGSFEGGELDGTGTFTWPDGRRYEGEFSAGTKRGQGEMVWPTGNRYVGAFENDQRHGRGTYYWRDGTIYQGQFANNRSHGFGIKRDADGIAEFQQWKNGVLLMNQVLAPDQRCSAQIDAREWMFQGEDCINGLAHGRGPAVSLDGELYVPEARFVLGHLVEGDVRQLGADS